MGVVGKVHFKHPSGIRSVDVVDLGDSQTGHSLRIKTPKGIKEFNLVTPDDSRASPIRIKTPWGVYSLAADGRNSAAGSSTDYAIWSSDSIGRSQGGTVTKELATTTFNKVVRVQAVVRVHVRVSVTGPDDYSLYAQLKARGSFQLVSVDGGATYTSSETAEAYAYSYAYANTDEKQATLAVTVPAGRYRILARVRAYDGRLDHPRNRGSGSLRAATYLDSWTEYTK